MSLSNFISLFSFCFLAFFCVKIPTMYTNGIKEWNYTRENRKKSSTRTQRQFKRWIPNWRRANLTLFGWSLQSFTSSMVSWLRREWYLIKLLKWTTVKWTIWRVCGASLAKWRSGMSKLIWWYYLSVRWPIPLHEEIQTRSKWQKVREKQVNRSRLVLVLSLIGWEKGVSVNHEACYCKTKVITLVSRNAHGIQVNQSESEAIPYSRLKAREKAREHVVVCFGFTSDWCRKWRFRQSWSLLLQNQSCYSGQSQCARNSDEPIRKQSKSMQPTQSAGKSTWACRGCFGFTSDWCRNGVSDNHEAYYCITKVITLSITMRTVIQMNQSEIKVTARS